MELWVNECTYPPSDDSLLAVEAMRAMAESGAGYERVLDLGTGSGVLAVAAHRIFRPRLVAAVDSSWCAAESAARNLPPGSLVAVCRDARCLGGSWDLVIVNPPYLPEEPPEPPLDCGGMLEASWRGLGVAESMVGAAAGLGREVLVVYSSLTRPSPAEVLRGLGFRVEVLARRAFFMEEIVVARGVAPWRG